MENEIYFKEVEMKRQKARGGYYHEGIILADGLEIKFSVLTNQNFYTENGKPEFLIGRNYSDSKFTFRELNVEIGDLAKKRELEDRVHRLFDQCYEEQSRQ